MRENLEDLRLKVSRIKITKTKSDKARIMWNPLMVHVVI